MVIWENNNLLLCLFFFNKLLLSELFRHLELCFEGLQSRIFSLGQNELPLFLLVKELKLANKAWVLVAVVTTACVGLVE